MYPDFIREAQASGASNAVHTFQRAHEAEAVHATLYGHALENLGAQRAAAIFYVCPVCGEVTDDVKMRTCPICGASAEKFEVFRS
jgi:rubrerythrin